MSQEATYQDSFNFYASQSQGLRRASDPKSGFNNKHGSEASKRAAIAIVPTSGTKRAAVLEVIVRAGRRGVTQWEIVERTGFLRSSVCGRCKELEDSHFIRRNGERVGPHGSSESVYFATARPVIA